MSERRGLVSFVGLGPGDPALRSERAVHRLRDADVVFEGERAPVEAMIEFGASPRGPIGLVQAARVLALLRGRGHVLPDDVRDLARNYI